MATEVARVSEEMRKEAEVAYLAIEAQEKKQAADAQSAQASAEHAAALVKLRAEYAALVASGDLQGAAAKLGEINAALRQTPGAAGDAAKAAEDSAAAIAAAYHDLGITTDASLRETAARAKGSFELLANSGTASARELGLAFADAA
ncbi:MAG: phage tail tape measure protein, partial [Burkholderiaceae bacterium]|nr:phage tail tape measure protein [Burkholderiaceae bacterium]